MQEGHHDNIDAEGHELQAFVNEEGTKEVEDTGNFFSLKAAVLGLWVPSVVGKTDYSFLLVSLTSFAARTMAFLFAWLLASLNIAHKGAFLFYCVEDYDRTKYENFGHCQKISSCLETHPNGTVQKIRTCNEDDQLLNIFGVWILLTGLLSLVGTFLLHKMTHYEHLFRVSQTCCWIRACPILPFFTDKMSPTIHRNLIFTILERNQDKKGAEKLSKILTVINNNEDTLETTTSRPLEGETPLISCTKQRKVSFAEVLLANGAKVEKNEAGEHPLNIAVMNRDKAIVELLLAHGALIKADKDENHPINIAVKNRDVEILRLLLENCAEFPKFKNEEHPINITVKNKDVETLTVLQEHGVAIQEDAVNTAVKNSDIPVLNVLLDFGANIQKL